MARNVLPAFDPGALFPVRLEDGDFHPFDSFLDNLVDGPALPRALGLLLAQRLGNVLAVAEPVFQGVDGGAGIVDRVVAAMDAEPLGPLLAGGLVVELEIEGRGATGDDRDIKAAAFFVVNLGPLGAPLLAMPVGEDDAAIAHAIGNRFVGDGISHGSVPERFWGL